MKYGIANCKGQPNYLKAFEIVDTACKNGVTFFDTAQVYGNSEEVLGKALEHMGLSEKVQIISKLSPEINPDNPQELTVSIESSLKKLKIKELWGLMLHNEAWLEYWGGNLGKTLIELKSSGKIKYLGVSIYSPEMAQKALDNPEIDIIQVPANVWDDRMKQYNIFETARKSGKLCFIRSIYLQGLLLMAPEEVKIKLPFAEDAVKEWNAILKERKISSCELSMAYAKTLDFPLVIGAESPEQVYENTRLFNTSNLTLEEAQALTNRMKPYLNERILNPSYWNR
jgi:aryl-alcohol dehydrogenase-like predicted oxidoreductase